MKRKISLIMSAILLLTTPAETAFALEGDSGVSAMPMFVYICFYEAVLI